MARKQPILTKEQEIELSRRIRENGDEDAFKQLVESNLGLVVYVVQKIPTWHLDSCLEREDLVQEGNIALMRAARTWVPQTRFATYARKLIFSQVMRAIENTGFMIHIPVPIQERIRKIKKAESVLTQKLNREPTLQEVADHVGMPVALVRDHQVISQRQPISLDAFSRDHLSEDQDHE